MVSATDILYKLLFFHSALAHFRRKYNNSTLGLPEQAVAEHIAPAEVVAEHIEPAESVADFDLAAD